MNDVPPRPSRALPWDELRYRLDDGPAFNTMRGTPYFRDARYEQFSAGEYRRRYAALRGRMREAKLDCMIVPGKPVEDLRRAAQFFRAKGAQSRPIHVHGIDL